MRGFLLGGLVCGLGPIQPATAQDFVFEPRIITECLATPGTEDACVAHAATYCIQVSPGGGTTYGQGACYELERAWWDGELNRVYQQLRALETTRDPRAADALREMQRGWIPFRDAACAYEYSRWGGGTGAGPANTFCLLELTATQTIRLRRYLQEMQ